MKKEVAVFVLFEGNSTNPIYTKHFFLLDLNLPLFNHFIQIFLNNNFRKYSLWSSAKRRVKMIYYNIETKNMKSHVENTIQDINFFGCLKKLK